MTPETPAPAPRPHSGEEGIVLLLVMVLVVVAISTAYAMAKTSLIEVLSTRQQAQYARADMLARSGIGLATRMLQDDLLEGSDVTKTVESDLDGWAVLSHEDIELPGGALLRVRIHDAGTKIDFNALIDGDGKRIGDSSKNFLKAFFAHLRDDVPEFKGSGKLEDPDIDELSDALLDWIDKDDETRVGTPEHEYYVEIKKSRAAPLNRPVFSLDELANVPGMNPLLLEALKAYFTPYPIFPGNNGGGVNLNTAPAHVLSLVYHGVGDDYRLLDQRDVFEILKARKDGHVFCPSAGQEPCTDFFQTLGIAAGEQIFPAPTYTSRVFSVDSEATIGETRACVHSVIDRGTGADLKTLFYELGC
ncbi:MAG TPA: type II secretion system minor pseudopilin GspK [Myxococcota bacterium]|nr:type II secretion system minor pseudopilin GspK [Myxococcota bacterium]